MKSSALILGAMHTKGIVEGPLQINIPGSVQFSDSNFTFDFEHNLNKPWANST
jgi:hypothetical protein